MTERSDFHNSTFDNRHSTFLADSIKRSGQASFPAAGAASGAGKAFAVFKYITALEALTRPDGQLAAAARQRAGNVRQMLVYFLFLNPHLAG